jgi:uncharacterized protein
VQLLTIWALSEPFMEDKPMELLKRVDHRPWPLPDGPWIMTQTWHDLLFAHWPLPPEAVRAVLPPTLAVDTFGGRAWIGVIPFRLSDIRLRGFPALPFVSQFPEINVRTYVRVNGKPGVYFLSLDACGRLAIAIARPWFKLPYHLAEITFRKVGNWFHFASMRKESAAPQARFQGTYCPCSTPYEAEQGGLERWLTERYCYYCVSRSGRTYRCDIHHEPWSLQKAVACFQENTMALSHGLELPECEPALHYAHYMKALIWPLRRVTVAGSNESLRAGATLAGKVLDAE